MGLLYFLLNCFCAKAQSMIEDLKAKSPGQLPLLSVCLCSPVNERFSFLEGTLTGK